MTRKQLQLKLHLLRENAAYFQYHHIHREDKEFFYSKECDKNIEDILNELDPVLEKDI
jgi:hypothetical protein